MALHDFVCADCDHGFEVFSVGFIKAEQQECPQCGSRNVRQKFSSFLTGGSGSGTSSGCSAPVGSPFG